MSTLLSSLPVKEHKFGWPWTEEVDTNIYCATRIWSKISIVIPSYNQSDFIEESIRSVLLQNYPNLELIVIDGASTDTTLAIIAEYTPWITYWESNKDNGQADAINKGIDRSSGTIFNWLNTDDLLAPLALYYIQDSFKAENVLAGKVLNFDQSFQKTAYTQNANLSIINLLRLACTFHQPGIWHQTPQISKELYQPDQYFYFFDKVFFINHLFSYQANLYIDNVLIYFRLHNQSKTSTIQKDKIDEIISFYRQIIINFSKYEKYIREGLSYQLLPEKLFNDWHNKYINSPFFKKIIFYLLIPIKSPKILRTRFYYIFLKKILRKTLQKNK